MPSYSGIFTLPAQMQAKAAGNWPVPPPSIIGQAYGGGFYAGLIGVAGVATHYLIIGPVASAQSTLTWKNVNTESPGALSVIDGPQNTANMIADGNSTVYPAAHFCNDLVIGGYSDWYMPAQNELEICYYNLKPTIENNNTSTGANVNAVPARASNYTLSIPTQTSVIDFKDTGAEDFGTGSYWSSTNTTSYAIVQFFNVGFQTTGTYTNARPVRAVRRIPV